MRLTLDASDTLSNDLMLFLPLADRKIGDGAKVVDISPFRRTACNVNATTIAYGPMGPVYQGVSPNVLVSVSTRAFANISDCGLVGLSARMSASMWVYLPDTSQKGLFFQVGGSGATDGFALGIGTGDADTNGNTILGLYCGVRWISTGVSFGTGWHHLAMTLDASGFPTIYYDGHKIYSDSTGAPTAVGNSGTTYVTVGAAVASGTPTFNRFSTGRFSGFRLWRRTLNSAEVARLARKWWAGTTLPPQWRYSTASPDVTKTLTGTSSTGSVGTVTAGVSTALPGRSATGSVGTITTGVASGVTGSSSTGTAGTVAAGASSALSGSAGTGATGGLGDGVDTPLTGLVSVGSVGNIGVSGDLTAALTGVQAVGSVGTITATVDYGGMDTHDGWKKRSRQQKRIDAAARRAIDDRAAEAAELRQQLEAALGVVAEELPDEVPAPVVRAVAAAPKPDQVDWAALAEKPQRFVQVQRQVNRLLAVMQAWDTARALAEDDEEVMMMLEALR